MVSTVLRTDFYLFCFVLASFVFCSVFAIVLCAVFVLGSTLVQALPFW